MDKEKVKMLQEVLGYFQEMQENNTLVEIAFKTSDGKLHGIGNPTALKLLLDVAVIELERQLRSARFGDAPEQLTMCREYKTVSIRTVSQNRSLTCIAPCNRHSFVW